MRLCPNCGARYEAPAQYCQRDGAPLRIEQEPHDPYLGTKIDGKFRLEKVVGSGGMGVVYSARDETLGRRVAVKILHKDLVTNGDVVSRFHREAQIAHQLDHLNIVRLILFGQLPDGNLYLVLEYLEGPTLLAAIDREGVMSPARTVKIVSAVADAIGYAHRRDIVHRDIKPENIILIDRDGDRDHPKVLDFGIAKMLMGGDTVVTQAGLIFGTARYISPEGAQGDPVDKRSDVYSLGIIAYQMLTGHTPFEAAEPVQLLLKHIHETPAPVRSHAAAREVSPALDAVVMRALAKVPAARYGDGAAFARALRESLVEPAVEPHAGIRSVVATTAMPVLTPPPNGSIPAANGGAVGSGSGFVPAAGLGANPYAPPYNHNRADNDAGMRPHHVVGSAHATMLSGSLAGAPRTLPPGILPAAPPTETLATYAPPLPTVEVARVSVAPYAPAEFAPPPYAPPPLASTVVTAQLPSPASIASGADPMAFPATPPVANGTGYPPSAMMLARTPAIHPSESEDDIVIPGMPRARRATRPGSGGRPAAGAGLRTGGTVLLSVVLTLCLGAGVVWTLGLYPWQRQEAQTNDLLDRAQDALQAERLVHAARGDNVEDLTDAVLALSPGQARARQLREAAARHLRNTAVESSNQGQRERALVLLQQAVRLAEDDTELNQLIARIQQEMAAPPVVPPVAPPVAPPVSHGTHTHVPSSPSPSQSPSPPAHEPDDPGETRSVTVPVVPSGLPTFTPGRDPSRTPPVAPPPTPDPAPPVVVPPAVVVQPPTEPPVVVQPPAHVPPPRRPPPAVRPPILPSVVVQPPPPSYPDPGGGTAF